MQLRNKEALATESWLLQRAVLLRLQWASMDALQPGRLLKAGVTAV
jgi:hypothetical protein